MEIVSGEVKLVFKTLSLYFKPKVPIEATDTLFNFSI